MAQGTGNQGRYSGDPLGSEDGPGSGSIAARRSLAAARNVETGEDLGRLMNAVMYDVLAGTLSPGEANAVVAAGRQTLRILELTLRYNLTAKRSLLE